MGMWDCVKWAKSDIEIARELGVSRQTVWRKRRQLGKPGVREGRAIRVAWGRYLGRGTEELACEMGVARSTVWSLGWGGHRVVEVVAAGWLCECGERHYVMAEGGLVVLTKERHEELLQWERRYRERPKSTRRLPPRDGMGRFVSGEEEGDMRTNEEVAAEALEDWLGECEDGVDRIDGWE